MTEKILHLNTEKNMFWALVVILFLCTGLYMYLVTTTIHNVVSRQNLENKATQISLAIAKSEYQYIGLRNNITLSYAYSLGFRDISEKNFISRNSNVKTMNVVSYLSR